MTLDKSGCSISPMLMLVLRKAMQVLRTEPWSQLCSRRWPNIWIPSMSLDGNALRRLHQQMSLRPIWLTTQWCEIFMLSFFIFHRILIKSRTLSRTKCNNCLWPNSSMTVSNARSDLQLPGQSVVMLQIPTFYDPSLRMLTLVMAVSPLS